jgi:hypothetical protein
MMTVVLTRMMVEASWTSFEIDNYWLNEVAGAFSVYVVVMFNGAYHYLTGHARRRP